MHPWNVILRHRRLLLCGPLLVVLSFVGPDATADDEFIRGEVNQSGDLDISDAISLLDYRFRAVGTLPCSKAADAHDSGDLDVSDAITILDFLFSGGERLAAHFPGCGVDLTDDTLTCETFLPCSRCLDDCESVGCWVP
jgi:hypothetical protein